MFKQSIPHSELASRVYDMVARNPNITHAALEFPAILVPHQSHLCGEDDALIEFTIIKTPESLPSVVVSYADYASTYTDGSIAFHKECWTLYDVCSEEFAAFTVLFHDVDDPREWMKKNAILTLDTECDDAELKEAFRCVCTDNDEDNP